MLSSIGTPKKFLISGINAVLVAVLSGCVSIAPIEPIKNPPLNFRADTSVAVEFLAPTSVGFRCAERGTELFGIPTFHSMACGNGKLITMPDPCKTITAGSYAALMCEGSRVSERPYQDKFQPANGPLVHVGFSGDALELNERRAPRVEAPKASTFLIDFVHPASVAANCVRRGLRLSQPESGTGAFCSDGKVMTAPNPCLASDASWYSRTLCHEMAHANGWASDHPGGSFRSDKSRGINPENVPPPRTIFASLDNLKPASQSPAALALADKETSERKTNDAPFILAQTDTQGAGTQSAASDAAINDQPVIVAVAETAKPKSRFEDLWNAILETWMDTPVLLARANPTIVPGPVLRAPTSVETEASRLQFAAFLDRIESVGLEIRQTWAGSIQAEHDTRLQMDEPQKTPDAPTLLRGRFGPLDRLHNL